MTDVHLNERIAALEARVQILHDESVATRERSETHSTRLVTLTAGHNNLAADVREIKTTLGTLSSTVLHVDGRLKNLEAKLLGGTAGIVAAAEIIRALVEYLT